MIGRCRCRSPVHGRTDRVSVADRDESRVTGFHPVGSSSQQQIWRVVVQQAGCTSRARISCLARWTCTWRWPLRDLSIGVRDVDAGLGERRQQAGCVAVAALLTEWRAALASQLACTQTRVALTPALAHLCAVLAVYSRSCGPAADTGAPVAGLYRRGAACTGGAATRGSAHGPLRLPLRLGRVWRTCSRQGILRTRWLDPRSNKLYVELSRRPVRGKFGVRRHTVS